MKIKVGSITGYKVSLQYETVLEIVEWNPGLIHMKHVLYTEPLNFLFSLDLPNNQLVKTHILSALYHSLIKYLFLFFGYWAPFSSVQGS